MAILLLFVGRFEHRQLLACNPNFTRYAVLYTKLKKKARPRSGFSFTLPLVSYIIHHSHTTSSLVIKVALSRLLRRYIKRCTCLVRFFTLFVVARKWNCERRTIPYWNCQQ